MNGHDSVYDCPAIVVTLVIGLTRTEPMTLIRFLWNVLPTLLIPSHSYTPPSYMDMNIIIIICHSQGNRILQSIRCYVIYNNCISVIDIAQSNIIHQDSSRTFFDRMKILKKINFQFYFLFDRKQNLFLSK